MGLKKGQELDIAVEDVAFGGRGFARIDGMVVFVDGAVAGDRVHARIVRKKKTFAEARTLTVLSPSPHRIDAPCPYSGYCGGCKWQYVEYEAQLRYKRRHVAEALAHIGDIQDVPVHDTIAAGPVFGYRNKMEFSCSDRRWLLPEELGKEGIGMGFALGLHVPGTFDKVLDIHACMLQPDVGNRILQSARAFMVDSGKPAYGLKSHAGFWRFLMLRHSVAMDRWMVNIVTATEDREIVAALADRIMAEFPEVISVVNNITARKSGVAFGEVEIPLAGSDALEDRIDGFRFRISANSFFQTNTRGAGRLYDTVKRYAGLKGDETVVDLFCGTGTISIFLAGVAREVVGLEMVASAIADAEENCRRNRITNCRFVAGDVRNTLKALSVRPEVMIIDPPRAGMHKDVVAEVLEKTPERIVYVSCNPATQARDLALMNTHYRVMEIQPVDMFPHTFHIEAVARLERR